MMNKKLTKAEINTIQKNVAGTLAIERLQASDWMIKVNKQFLEGKLTSQEVIQKTKSKYCVMTGRLGKW